MIVNVGRWVHFGMTLCRLRGVLFFVMGAFQKSSISRDGNQTAPQEAIIGALKTGGLLSKMRRSARCKVRSTRLSRARLRFTLIQMWSYFAQSWAASLTPPISVISWAKTLSKSR